MFTECGHGRAPLAGTDAQVIVVVGVLGHASRVVNTVAAGAGRTVTVPRWLAGDAAEVVRLGERDHQTPVAGPPRGVQAL